MTVGCVIRTSPLRNKVSHAVSADTASARMATTSANNETVELNKSVIKAVFSGMPRVRQLGSLFKCLDFRLVASVA